MMMFNLRGPSGAGKSTVGRKLVAIGADRVYHEPILKKEPPRYPLAYELEDRNGGPSLFVLGRYHNLERGGGMDGLEAEGMEQLLRYYKDRGHVFFEALPVSGAKGRWRDIADEVGRKKVVFAYLTTPPDVCIAQVYKRNGGIPIKEDLIRSHHRQVHNTRRWFQEEGYVVANINHETAFESMLRCIKHFSGWEPKEETSNGG